MSSVKCDNFNCIWNNTHYCERDVVEFVAVYPDKLERFNKCNNYEKRTDYIEFFEWRGFE